MFRSNIFGAALLVPLFAVGAALGEDLPQAAAPPTGSTPALAQPAEAPAVSAPAVQASGVVPVAAPTPAAATPKALADPATPAPSQAATVVPATLPPVTEPSKATETAPAPYAMAAELADRLGHDKAAGTIREDRDAALKFYEGRHGAPLWITADGMSAGGKALIAEIGAAGDYGLDPSVFKLPGALDPGASPADRADAEATLTLAALKYARYARGGRMDPQALSIGIDRKAQVLPPALVLEKLAAADKPDVTLRGFQPQNPQFEKLRQKWLAVRAGQQVLDAPAVVQAEIAPPKSKKKVNVHVAKVLTPAALERKLLVNMEMWRWMPTLGTYYIQPNIPEFMVRVVKDGHVVHAERIVTGQPDKKTPIFSDEMRIVVFKPFWNVPDSIKYKEMLPQLMRGSSLERAGYRAEINGRVAEPGSIDWMDVDMRQVHIFQPPGAGNALGRVKFLFPNKHDVYLHDTPAKNLFNASVRDFSHGCVRVRDPLALAEVLLGTDKGWTRAQVDKQASSGPDNTEIKLDRPVPIHITYFTARVDDDGKLQLFDDIYGHENRVQLGLEGKTSLIAHESHEEHYSGPTTEERRRYAERKRQKQDPVGEWFEKMFN